MVVSERFSLHLRTKKVVAGLVRQVFVLYKKNYIRIGLGRCKVGDLG